MDLRETIRQAATRLQSAKEALHPRSTAGELALVAIGELLIALVLSVQCCFAVLKTPQS
jgi:hypothetical protein